MSKSNVYMVEIPHKAYNSFWTWVNENKACVDRHMNKEDYEQFTKCFELLQNVEAIRIRLKETVRRLDFKPSELAQRDFQLTPARAPEDALTNDNALNPHPVAPPDAHKEI